MTKTKPRVILLIHDSLADRATVRNYLSGTSDQYEFIEAESKAQALEFIEILHFDCIILDSLLTNLEILRELSKPSTANKTPIILLSDSRLSETAIEALKLAGNDCLWKAEMTANHLQQAAIRCIEKADLQAQRAAESAWPKAVLESVAQSVIAINTQGKINYFNAAAEKLTGWQATDAMGQDLTKMYRRSAGTSPGNLLSPDGRVVLVADSSAPIQDSFGNILGTVFVFREAPNPNQFAQNKDDFIALIAHEMRNPLNSILGYTRLVRMQKNLPAQALQMLEIIERNGQAQLQFITDLLDSSRMTNGELKLEVRAINLTQVLQEAVTIMRPAAEAKAISMTVKIAENLPLITADPERLQQLISKLISQAMSLTSYEGNIAIQLWREEANIYLQIVNNGNGSEPHLLPHIFDPFSQIEGTPKHHLGRSGLNLTLVRHLVELHGGSIKAESPGLGLGVTFTVSLPIQTNAVTGIPSEENALEKSQFTGLKLLVIEDEQDSQELIKTVLTEVGAVVTLASSAKDAYNYLTNSPDKPNFDLLISDINLPDEDGYSLIRRIRKHPQFSLLQLPAIALMVVSQAEDRIRCLRAGFQTHLSKPINSLDLLTVIGAILDAKD